MSERPLLFEIFRLNIVDDENSVFEFMWRRIRSDEEIVHILHKVTESKFDLEDVSGRNTFRWSVREFTDYEIGTTASSMVCSVTLGRSTLLQSGQTVTDDRFEDAMTQMSPPMTETIHLVFYMRRHLVIVEHNSSVLRNQSWRTSLHTMLDEAARSLEFLPGLRLEPVPQEQEILREFRSFQRLTRLRAKLRIPNPELDRRTEQLRQEMVDNEIREYTQDMKNPAGLSTSENGRAFATAAMAQAGYKEGEITMSGIRGGRRVTSRTGSRAARGRIDGFKDFIRGMSANAKTNETKNVVARILEEVDRLVEPPPPPIS
jgi:hypothetical protein